MTRKTWKPATALLAVGLACCLGGWLAAAAALAQDGRPIGGRIVTPPHRTGATQPTSAEANSGPAPTEKGPWTDVAAGMTVKFTVVGSVAQTREITQVDANTVTIKTTTDVQGTKPVEAAIPRFYTLEQVGQIMAALGKKTGDQTLRVGDVEYSCEVYERVMVIGNRRGLTRTWLCKKVPGWTVRVDNDASGEMKTILELVGLQGATAATTPATGPGAASE
jgi:hypothetical protein